MRILFLVDNFPPEVNAPATRTWEHCRRWAKTGATVTVITCAPNFPRGRIFPGYRNRLFQREQIEGVDVIRVWSFMASNDGFFSRVVDFLSFSLTSFIAGLFQRTDVIVATSPQFFVALSASALAVVKHKPWIFEVRDIWPESIVAVGLMRPNWLYRLLEKMELRLYRSATAIIIVSEAFRQRLTSRGVPARKVFTIPNGADLSQFKPRVRDSALVRSLGLEGKFVIGFVGTHGLAHALDFVLDCSKDLSGERIHFLLLGDGAKKPALVARARAEAISNVTFLDPVPHCEVPAYVAICDAMLVNLKKSDTFKCVIPSKIFEAAAMERPMLIGVDGMAREIVEEYGSGLFFQPEDRGAFAAAVRRLREDPRLQSELRNGCRKMAATYDRSVLAKQAFDLLQDIAAVPTRELMWRTP
jgi:glycosyltransferase involved in cell wall biosynthesis